MNEFELPFFSSRVKNKSVIVSGLIGEEFTIDSHSIYSTNCRDGSSTGDSESNSST